MNKLFFQLVYVSFFWPLEPLMFKVYNWNHVGQRTCTFSDCKQRREIYFLLRTLLATLRIACAIPLWFSSECRDEDR